MGTAARVNETSIIALITQHFEEFAHFLGDDCATLTPPPVPLISSVDTLVEGVHFYKDMPAEALGWKSLAVNLSDIAAMGGEPLYFLLSLALPQDTSHTWLSQFLEGLSNCARQYGISLVGGDTVRSPLLTLSITVMGQAVSPLKRGPAQVGDTLFVSGPLGLSAAGLHCLQHHLTDYPALIKAHYYPKPRLAFGQRLQQYPTSALMDCSDGLGASLREICQQAGGLGCQVDLSPLMNDELRAFCQQEHQNSEALVLYGGEDYELVFCAPRESIPGALAIGKMLASPQIKIYNEKVEIPFDPDKGFQHFDS